MAWRPLWLPPTAADAVPLLLVSTLFTSASYTIQLTDLSTVWSEELTRADIIARARKEHSSIDPGDDEQFQILLQKIRSAVDGGAGTALALSVETKDGRSEMVLDVRVQLPAGLEPLKWFVRMREEGRSAIKSRVLGPLIRAQAVGNRETHGLVAVLGEKDAVIQKMLEKLAEQGVDLGLLFHIGKPGVKLDKRRAEEKVKGLGTFNFDAWRENLDCGGLDIEAALLAEVFIGEDLLDVKGKEGTNIVEGQDAWWKDLAGERIDLSCDETAKSKVVSTSETEDDGAEDRFQVQATPPHLKTSKQAADSKIDDESTEDDTDDLDAPSQAPISQRSIVPDSYVPPKTELLPKSLPKGPGTEKPKKQDPTPSPNQSTQTLQNAADDQSTRDQELRTSRQSQKQGPVDSDSDLNDLASISTKSTKSSSVQRKLRASTRHKATPIDPHGTESEDNTSRLMPLKGKQKFIKSSDDDIKSASPKVMKKNIPIRKSAVSARDKENSDTTDSEESEAGLAIHDKGKSNAAAPNKKEAAVDPEATESDDDEKPVSSKRNRISVPIDAADTTESESDVPLSPRKAISSAKKGALGKIGGKKAPIPDSDTDEPIPKTTPNKGRLGKIGGRRLGSPDSAGAAPGKKKLGTIGGRRIKKEENSAKEEDGMNTESEDERVKERRPRKEMTAEELEEEREALAMKKREVLKRELEAKAQMPVKKKRKF